ncbi:hypothetical protein Pmani_020207 [Petrolisthes manimaculis]|uniref:Uncharacterized protein n=1 Tax=Petrolisthes manimaculis TaxID=1843537 RepID=A0AAE1PGQ5_9EUCA|nr:hypothetical protein Pmani_020207 [Petrolisthes manimaculis]
MGREALQLPREAPPRTPCAPLPNYKLAHRLITAACRSLPPRKFGSYTQADIRPRFPNPDNYTLSTGQPDPLAPFRVYLFLLRCVLLFFFHLPTSEKVNEIRPKVSSKLDMFSPVPKGSPHEYPIKE